MDLKEMSVDLVGIIVMWALLDQGHVTTLEIKRYLRRKGYNAKQAEISQLVDQFVSDFVKDNKSVVISNVKYIPSYVHKVNSEGQGYREYCFVQKSTPAPTAATLPTVRTKEEIRDYIHNNADVSSYLLSTALGIPASSVRAYKANINR